MKGCKLSLFTNIIFISIFTSLVFLVINNYNLAYSQIEFNLEETEILSNTNGNAEYILTSDNPQLKILDARVISDDSNSDVIGEIMNNNTEPVESVQIISSIYDPKGLLLSTGDTELDIDQLRPGEKTGFKISLSDKVTKSKKLVISTNYELSEFIKPGFLKLILGKTDKDNMQFSDFEEFKLVGEVVNMGSGISTDTKVTALFFGKDRKLIDYDWTRLKDDSLNPGQKSPFEITIFSETAGSIQSFSLNVQSNEYSMTIENKEKK